LRDFSIILYNGRGWLKVCKKKAVQEVFCRSKLDCKQLVALKLLSRRMETHLEVTSTVGSIETRELTYGNAARGLDASVTYGLSTRLRRCRFAPRKNKGGGSFFMGEGCERG
jgi:hypothetical protein